MKTFSKKQNREATVAKAKAMATHNKKDKKKIGVHNLLILDESGSIES